ncbi:hypothetical protein HDV05_002790 [Chytridiales sp. JEL 0842]|nr:hypothetical protein HDV05_002790 [Chytridiales sp. JEL 0842]
MLPIVALTSLLAATVAAAPLVARAPYELPAFNAPSQTFTSISTSPSTSRSRNVDLPSTAARYLASASNTTPSSYLTTSSTFNPANGVHSVHFQEVFKQRPVFNLVANVNLDTTGQILSAGRVASGTANAVQRLRRRAEPSADVLETPKLDELDVLKGVAFVLGQKTDGIKFNADGALEAPFALEPVSVGLGYYFTAQNTLELSYEFRILMEENWYNVFASANTGDILGVADWYVHEDTLTFPIPEPSTTVAPSEPATTTAEPVPEPTTTTTVPEPKTPPTPTYLAIPFTENDPRQVGLVSFVDPADREVASPAGWHNTTTANGELETMGNNLRAQLRGQTLESRNGGKFDWDYDPSIGADEGDNPKAALTNTFYISNVYHDVLYRYGFTEEAGNFQEDTFGRGGKGGDAIIANVQAPGRNNANFGTGPDGTFGRMNMFLWNYTTPIRDSDLENGILVHELTHGLSNRLTGGTGNANCLRSLESGGMGEGWSDTLSWIFIAKNEWTRETNLNMGEWSRGGVGIRAHPYSTNLTTNPLLYSSIPTRPAVHFIGTIWSTILYEAYHNVVEQSGFQENYLANFASTAGNIRFLQLVVDGMKLQPCIPTFKSARDAILAADGINYKGEYRCALWRAFAKRGLGIKAEENVYVDSFELPEDC